MKSPTIRSTKNQNSTEDGSSDLLEIFTASMVLRVYGSKSPCDKLELLAETELIENTEWKEFKITLRPSIRIEIF